MDASSSTSRGFGNLHQSNSNNDNNNADAAANTSTSASAIRATSSTRNYQPTSLQLQPLVIVDDTYRYCDICLKDFMAYLNLSKESQGRSGSSSSDNNSKCISMTRLTKYSLSTSTSALKIHLEEKHSIILNSTKSLKLNSSKPPTNAQDFFRNVTMTSQKKVASVNNDILTWFALDMQPFSAVGDKGLKYFFSRHLPGLNLPSESTLRKTCLSTVYDELKAKVKDELSWVTCMCLMFNGWTDKHNKRHFLVVTTQPCTCGQ
jgi:hypothetical protein